MTTGDKIQKYREMYNISPEELAERLNIPPETLFHWENGQVIPSEQEYEIIKNLQFFEETEIQFQEQPQATLYGEEVQQSDVPPDKKPPIEKYIFNFTKKDAQYFYSQQIITLIIRTVLFSLVLVAMSFSQVTVNTPEISASNNIHSAAPFFLGILFVYLIIKAAIIVKTVKYSKKATEEFNGATHEYSFYPTYIKIRCSKNNEHLRTHQFNIRDIRKIERKGNYIRILANGKYVILKENEIPPESPFLYYINTSPPTKNHKTKSKYSLLSTVLFVLSILSLFFAMATLVLVMEKTDTADIGMTWIFFLFTPIPLSSLAFGLFSMKKGYGFKKNIVVGIIICGLLCCYGSFTFIFKDVTTTNPELFIETEELTGIDLPEYTSIRTQDWTQGNQNTSRGYIFETTSVKMTNLTSESFRSKVLGDERWLDKIPTRLLGISSAYCDNPQYEYVLILNVYTGEYNTLPEENGTYRFINIVFSAKNDSLVIVDYEIEYTE